MIFPIGDDNIKGGFKPLFSYSFLLLNVLIFIYQFSIGGTQFFETFSVTPAEISSGANYYSLVTSAFLHAGFMHIAGNMLYLWIFGDNIEAIIGNISFFFFYIIGGIVATYFHIFLDPVSQIPLIGASGAISAIMGAYLVMFPKSRIKMIFIVFFKKFYIPAFLFLIFWFLQQVYMVKFESGDENGGGVAWWAHIGGFVYGLIVGAYFKYRYKDIIEEKSQLKPDYHV